MRAAETEATAAWEIARRNPDGSPAVVIAQVGRVRLQLFRHIARPWAWSAFALGALTDVTLASVDLADAQEEAIALLAAACAPPAERHA